MTRKALSLLSLLLIIVPCSLWAQDLETFIYADQITVNRNNTLKASGNVLVRRGDQTITADVMIVNEELNKIDFVNIQEFFDGGSVKFAAPKGTLSSDLSKGIISSARVLIDESVRIQADEIELKDGTIKKAKQINRITSCEECESGFPLWHFTASSAINDLENQNIIYRNVTLRVRGILIGYIPYLRLPNPDVDRARGFLIPGLKITSTLEWA